MTDTQHYIINCPACGKQMKKVFVEEANVNVDICTEGCGGMFFDNRELERFDEEHENTDAILKEVEGKEFEPRNEQEVRICPICDIPMTKLGGENSVQIDVCNVCGGKFLDNGELIKIREGKIQPDNQEELFKELEQSAYSDALGKVGTFVNKKFIKTPFRDAFEHIVSKLI